MYRTILTALSHLALRRWLLLLIAAALLAATLMFGCQVQETELVVLGYVSIRDRNHILIIDPYEARAIGKIYAGDGPESIRVRPGGEEIWVANRRGYQTTIIETATHAIKTTPLVNPVFTSDGSRYYVISDAVHEFDAETGFLISTASVEIPNPWRAVLTPDDRWLYICQRHIPGTYSPDEARTYDKITVYDTEERVIAAEIEVGNDPYDIAISPNGRYVITANVLSRDITIIDTATLKAVRTIPLDRAPRSIMVRPDGTQLVVATEAEAEGDEPRVGLVITFQTNFEDSLEISPYRNLALGESPGFGAFTPEGDRLVLIDRATKRIFILDPGSLAVLATLSAGPGVGEIGFSHLPARSRDRIKSGGGPDRSQLYRIFERMKGEGQSVRDMVLTQRGTMYAVQAEGGAATLDIRLLFRPPGEERVELGENSVLIYNYGVPLPGQGRLSDVPQSLGYLLYAVYNLSPEQFLKHLAGDLDDAPPDKLGIAADVIHTEVVDGIDVVVIGASQGDYTSSQLWVSAHDGLPRRLLERIPYAPIIRESRFEDYRAVAGGRRIPFVTRRLVQHQLVGETQVVGIQFDVGLADSLFAVP
ncbi:hypothetical protein AMJ39_07290 [candidate division TA06 bacterium DG_24]|uniref:Uncharacterized protein n=3 Tax=Bacteria division TA06 TaxID=1156500 RepID=A0A0S8JPC4_UNCT6|nr:MAG: hypothetical protein AMJ39_07290 [candidate division TA06 bacterium DG_24]KPK69091.1 MAG: hypothetical protein AMJ82_06510 [candidate division TA06 bacterium SM23_40]KPL11607.1 MAG: hypothetical protein AMJ71_00040 [candidate division TA06 bacterium SM1_40]